VQPTEPAPRKGRRIRNIVLGITGAFILLVIIANVTTSNSNGGGGSPSSAPQVTTPAASPAPSPTVAARRVLLRMSGSGIQNSAPFLVSSGTLTVRYSYDCSADGGSGNFIADIETGDQSSLDSDDQSVANALGSGGSAVTTVYPQDVGSMYHLAVNSECSWSVVVKQDG